MGWGGGGGVRGKGFVCWLLACLLNVPATSQGRICKETLNAATLRKKLQIKLSTSPSHSIPTPGQPVPALGKGSEGRREEIQREREGQRT